MLLRCLRACSTSTALRRGAAAGLAATFTLLAASPAVSSPSEEAAELTRAAMEDDFLATDFKAALTKTKQALKLCAKCDNPQRAQIYRDLAILYATGFNNKGAALVNFQKAVRLDRSVSLPRAYASPTVKSLFLKAGGRKETLLHDAVNAQQKDTPVPIYAELLGEVPDAILTAHYRVEGKRAFTELTLDAVGTGFGGYLPCDALLGKASVDYYVTLAVGGQVVSSVGSEEAPLTVKFVEEVDGEVRSLPGDDAPERCQRPVVPDDEPEEEEAPPPPDPARERKTFWLSLGVQQDIALVGGDDVCTSASQEAGPFVCFRADGSQYRGFPVEGVYDKIDTGFLPATTRVLLGVDVAFGKRVSGFGKFGYAFGTGPTEGDLPESQKLHAEGGLKYWFTSEGSFPADSLGVYGAASGGLGQTDAVKNVPVQERTDVTAPQPNPAGQQVDAWAKYGQGFGALGLGAFYPIGPGALMLDLRAVVHFPSTGFVVAPALGYGIGL